MTAGRGSPLRPRSSRPRRSRGAASVCSVRARTVAGAVSPHHARWGANGALRDGGAMPSAFVGLDVSKDQIDVRVQPTGEQWRVEQTDEGRAQLAARLAGGAPALAVVE